MEPHEERAARCAIILAGGDGKRLAGLTRQITGEAVPKQFCQLIGDTSMVQQTRRRVSLTVDDERIFTTLTRTHERFYSPILGSVASRNLIVQPESRGTAPAILYSLLRLAATNPLARVAIFPSDHFIDDDRKFMRHVEMAFAVTALRPEFTVLLGIAPQWPEPGYGWIEPGAAIGGTPVFLVRRFWEKPRSEIAGELLGHGCLWNSFVMVGRLSTLLGLFLIALPELYLAFNRIRPVIDTAFEEKTLQRVYADLRSTGFSERVLAEHPVNLAVLPVHGVEWSDLGEPRRVMDTIARTGIRPQWLAA
ncbi:MAG TPA: sugar phosphate nucleotidyltransferase [Candidatus Binataceae bacterium]|nr:sugar phosphate nucleotidyltransferase [Candidatus Binataceae bacterium]